ncbi:MAG: excinuclease ABC subunit UvrA [Planctomycetales bacterium]|nr:excinuclease ABC subunit UvrA [Planctomycetales bacterium]NIM09370.1 excinuclease ABC subunit UvrA [Planctomycetales bacterium]NIN08837.1 excinuclease ABC subunit UvrA [Planctomycetales bacterium]NIN77954.1 excinuclease ABC subunit UvrA [Planctomycetales bacterium]NIO35137.1 excinuclease ABC subunit UvrA [Planctomycetales bacterium]
MAASDLVIKGAREHNLCNVDVVLPRNQLICLTGVSGSGKSSLAFDTIYAEGQRRYVESLSSFARQFLGQMPKPEVDLIEGLSPTISISQKTSGRNPRSTVGTITEIYDYLRVLYARVGQGYCPQCDRPITAQTREQIIGRIMGLAAGTRFSVLAPVIRGQKGEYRDLFAALLKQGFVRARVDGTIVSLTDDLSLDRQMRHDIEVVVDRLVAGPGIRPRLSEAIENALRIGEGNLIVGVQDADSQSAEGPQSGADRSARGRDTATAARPGRKATRRRVKRSTVTGDLALSSRYACTHCETSFEPLTPQLFSFNSPQGMCLECDGLGQFFSFDPDLLIPNRSLNFQQGCIELIGKWRALGRWKRHIYQGVADTVERIGDLERGTMLEMAWEELDPELQSLWLWGTGEQHITFTWRNGPRGSKYGGKFEGIIPELLSKYRNSHSKPQIRQLEKYMNEVRCPDCQGQRLNRQACAVRIESAHPAFADQASRSLPEVCDLPVSEAVKFFAELRLDDTRATIAAEVLKEIRGRLGFLLNVGLDYLSLNRTAPTLSGGESQRIRLAGQIGCGLVGVLYILDEPSIGLHPRDNRRLLDTLTRLRDAGNTVVVVEHDEETMRAADHIIDFGPGPGVRGGEVVAHGDIQTVTGAKRSVTGQYLSGQKKIDVPTQRRVPQGSKVFSSDQNGTPHAAPGKRSQKKTPRPVLTIRGARHNNLKNIDVKIPLGTFTCVTGVSGSGKSSLVNDILIEALRRDLNGGTGEPGAYRKIEGLRHLDKMIAIDQSPIGRTPRSNPATYIKVFDEIRKLYAQLPEAKKRGYKPGRFSFNVQGGRCQACEGNGANKLEMDFLAAVWVTCPVCSGHRFNRETLQVQYKGKSIADVLEMDIQEALDHFENVPLVRNKLQTLHDVGLDYLKLGQPSPTLSGGEAQRIKLARELVKRSTGQTLYLLDEPTTGLHFADIQMLLDVLHAFVEAGNTVLVVEHNLDVVKTADWVIDLGPEGGAGGGQVVVAGTPEDVAADKPSHTGQALAPILSGKTAKRSRINGKSRPARRAKQFAPAIRVQGARQHNLKSIDVEIPRDQMTVCCGMSGSGKTSLAMDTIYAEGQRRYVESLSSYARQFVAQMEKPQLDHIDGLSPAIAIEQKQMGHTPRSTVGTVTEVYDYLRILLARLGTPYCPACEIPVGTQTADEVIDKVMGLAAGTKAYLMAPLSICVGESYEKLWKQIRAAGYVRVRIDGQTHSLDNPPDIDRRRRHDVEVVVDRISVRPALRGRIADSVENALALGEGVIHLAVADDSRPETDWEVQRHSQHFACDRCHRSFEPLTPHNFSFNSWLGWCESCEGLGTETGANLSALLRDDELTLREGAVEVWPASDNWLFDAMLTALSQQLNLPLDVPFRRLSSRQRRTVLYGAPDRWIEVAGKKSRSRKAGASIPAFRFQYKGIYPALDEASRLSARFRARLEHLLDEVACSDCGGSRLRDDAAAVRFRDRTMDDYCRMPLDELLMAVQGWKLDPREKKIAGELVREITSRVQFLCDVGLAYLALARPAPTLSGGESQRIRLASQVGSGLCGVLYVLDEPTIGLHPRDTGRLLKALYKLRDLGNTLLLVEHDRDVVTAADGLLDFGPAAGQLGGEIVARGAPAQVARRRASVTGPYLSGKKAIPVPTNRRQAKGVSVLGGGPKTSSRARRRATAKPQIPDAVLQIVGARHNNLKNVDVQIPLGLLTAVTGVSGSGKSSLVEDVLYNALARTLHRASTVPGSHDAIRGREQINKVIRVDQRSLGNTPSSNPATYTGVFEWIRMLFAQLPEAKLRGYTARRFSFNASGGRCDYCEGAGQVAIEMHFLPDVWVPCDVCHGKRYNPETLAVRFHGQSIADVLEMPCGKALQLFENIPRIRRTLQTLCDVGLDYVQLGQPAPTLSGGEAQRVKLAAELARPDTGQTLYLLDEPTTGLHFEDLRKLLAVLNRLVDLGNTVVVIEHNLDVIKSADWIIELGPEAGQGGGHVVACGTPEDVVAYAQKANKPKRRQVSSKRAETRSQTPRLASWTGAALAPVLAAGPYEKRQTAKIDDETKKSGDMEIDDVGSQQSMPWELDGRGWHTKRRVGRSGNPCRWDGEILNRIVDRIHELGDYADTNWNHRSVVEISSQRKADGWFFHAITGEEWLIQLKFRVAKRTFQREQLVERLGMTPLNEMDALPVYGTDRRVRCKNLRGPWQEVELKVHQLDEIDTPHFWKFLSDASQGFQQITKKKQEKPDDLMPWKVMGKKWHLHRKGFPPGKPATWKPQLLEQLVALLEKSAPDGKFVWTNQVLVNLYLPGQQPAWATFTTKRPTEIELILTGPQGEFPLGRIVHLARERRLTTKNGYDQVHLKFQTLSDLTKKDPEHGDLQQLLKEHYAAVTAQAAVTI